MTPEESDRLRFMTWHDTVRRLSQAAGLTPPQLELVRQDLLRDVWPPGSIPADLEPARARLLDEICHGLAVLVGGSAPDFPPADLEGGTDAQA